jgi:hypothetical protein
MTSPDKKLAKDIATHLDRRRTRRRLVVLLLLAAAVVVAVLYLTCGRGWGIGGKGKGKGEGPGSAVAVDAGPRRCVIRITGAGLTLDGKPATREAAVAACRATTGADVVVTGDARQGDWDELRAALEAANIAIYKR